MLVHHTTLLNPPGCTSLAIMLHDCVDRSLISIKHRLQQFSVFLRSQMRTEHVQLCPVHTYPDIFESPNFSLRIRFPSTRI